MALQFTTRQIKNAAITTAKVADDAITNAKIADDAVDTAQLADGAVDNARLAANAVTAAKMDLTGTFDYTSGVLSVAAPTADAHAATKAYVDNAAVGLYWKEPVRAATTANITLSGTQTIDGVSIVADDRVLVKNQSTASENGVYVCAAGAWSRAIDMDAAGEFSGTAMFVQEGTTYADTAFVCTNDGDVVVGTTAIAFVQFAGNGSIVGGDGIAVTGNSVAVDLATNAGLEFSGGKLRAKVQANQGLGLDANGLGVLVKEGLQIDSGSINVRLDGSTLAQSGSGLKIADGAVGTTQLTDLGVTAAKLAANAVETAKINNGAVTTAKIAADAVDGTKIADDAVASEHISDAAVLTAAIADANVTTAKIADANVSTAKIADLAITNAKLGADSVDGAKIADDAVANEHIAANAVQAAQLNAGAVETAKILDLNVTTGKIADDAITLAKVGWQPEVSDFTGDGSAVAFDLGHSCGASFHKMVQVFVNGQAAKYVASSPADASEYAVDENTGTSRTRITFGAAPESSDVVQARYIR